MPTAPRGSWRERFTNEGKESVREWKLKKKSGVLSEQCSIIVIEHTVHCQVFQTKY